MSRSSWFKDDPSLAWGFYSHRQQLYESAKPHEGFRILHEFCSKAEDYFIITSNVDSQFQKVFQTKIIIYFYDNLYWLYFSSVFLRKKCLKRMDL